MEKPTTVEEGEKRFRFFVRTAFCGVIRRMQLRILLNFAKVSKQVFMNIFYRKFNLISSSLQFKIELPFVLSFYSDAFEVGAEFALTAIGKSVNNRGFRIQYSLQNCD